MIDGSQPSSRGLEVTVFSKTTRLPGTSKGSDAARGPARPVLLVVAMALLATVLVGVSPDSGGAAASDEVVGWVLDAGGQVVPLGGAPFYGDISDRTGVQPVALVATPSGKGYYIAEANGRVNAFGDAVFRGDPSGLVLDRPIVDMALSTSGHGYLLLGSDGGVFNYGNLGFYGSVPQLVPLAAQTTKAVAIIGSPDGKGYWIVHDDGGMFTFGSARFHGSVPQFVPSGQLAGPIVAAMPSTDFSGYGMVGSDGGVFAFGSYAFRGSQALAAGTAAYVGGSSVPDGGYVLLDSAGGIHRFGAPGSGGKVVGTKAQVVSGSVDVAIIGTRALTASTTTPTTHKPATTTTTKATTTTTKATTTTTKATTTTTSGGGGQGNQVTVFNVTGNAGPAQYIEPSIGGPSNFTSPVNYTAGSAYIRYNVITMPSTKPVNIQICFWDHMNGNWKLETCSSESALTVTKPGVYYVNLKAPGGWWKITGSFPWYQRPDVVRIMVKDAATKKLMMSSKCGSYCYTGNDLSSRVPIKIQAELIFTSGGTFNPPASWTGFNP